MNAISIREPWAWAILHAGKDVENRDWPTRFRGTVAVHATKGLTRDEHLLASMQIEETSGLRPPAFPMLKTRGFVVGLVDIIGCVDEHSSPWFQGEYGFLLENPRPLVRPVYCRGALGFWNLPPEVEALVREQLREAA
jgi:hypothetical protein